MKVLSVGREDAGRVIEPRKKSLVEMADGVRPNGRQHRPERYGEDWTTSPGSKSRACIKSLYRNRARA